jgi:hypothetical protein
LINKFDNLKQGAEHFDQYMKQKVG